jgi:hypothetical protein
VLMLPVLPVLLPEPLVEPLVESLVEGVVPVTLPVVPGVVEELLLEPEVPRSPEVLPVPVEPVELPEPV